MNGQKTVSAASRGPIRILRGGIVLALVVTVGVMTPAAHADESSGFWYFNDYRVSDAHQSGVTGAGATVAILDSPLNIEVSQLQSADITVHTPGFCDVSASDPGVRLPATTTNPREAHGTSMASLIVGNGQGPNDTAAPLGVAPDAKILYYATSFKMVDSSDTGGQPPFIECVRDGSSGTEEGGAGVADAIRQAVDDGADIISMSFTANKSRALTSAIEYAVSKKVVLVAGLGNDGDSGGLNAEDGVLSVQSMDATGAIQGGDIGSSWITDVVGPGVGVQAYTTPWDTFGPVTGTSNATAITSGFLALVKSKYPAATGNQLLQTAIHNTGAEDHDLYYDPDFVWGYGALSLTHMLSVDPTHYPDVNPLLNSDERLFNSGAADEPGDSPTSSAAHEPVRDDGVPWMPIALVGGIALVIVAGGITWLVTRSRSIQATQNPQVPTEWKG